MSKKIAEGTRNLILDVKIGQGAFMKTLDQGRELAQTCIALGEGMGCSTRALLTQMDQPLGIMIGNALEVQESIDLLKGKGPSDCRSLIIRLAEELLELAGRPRSLATERLDSGAALEKFYEMVKAQGGDITQVKEPTRLPRAPHRSPLIAPHSGYVTTLNARQVGDAAVILGAGRRVKSDEVDPSVGIELVAKIGSRVEAGEPLLWIHHDERGLNEASERLLSAYQISDEPADEPTLIYELVTP